MKGITPGPETAAASESSEERFSKVFRASPVAIILRTRREGRVVDVNERYGELVGFSREELVGRTVAELNLWADPAEGERVLARLWRDGVLRGEEGRFRRKSGEIRDVLIWAELATIGGEPVAIGMIIDLTERKRMETELRRSREQLRSLSARLQQIREEERIRVARELHDELGGFLTVLKLDLASLARDSGSSSPEFRQKVESMSARIVEAIGAVRRMCTELRPSVLDNIGITAAIEWEVLQFQQRSGVRCTMSAALDDAQVDADRATAAFRILQEALTNVARHAQATRVRVTAAAEPGALRLVVEDDGRGIPEQAISDSTALGILGMRERVFPFGGTVEIRGVAGRGTTVDVHIPLA